MRIAHVVYECEPGRFLGGVQKMVYELAQAQAARGDEVEIITVGDRPQLQIAERLKIRYFPGKVHWGSVAIREVLFREQARFDLIHSHNTFLPLNRFVAATARRFSTAVYFNSHGALDPVLLTGWHGKAWKKRIYNALFERPNLNTACGVIGLTGEECRQLQRFGVTVPIYELANGIALQAPPTPDEVDSFRARVGVAAGVPIVVFIGRITPKKRIHCLIEAMTTVRQTVPAVRLVICGGREVEPDYTAELEALILKRGLGEVVRWAGFLDEKGKRGAYGAARVFAHPSESEGMALAILEAMSFGVPTVVTPGCYMLRAAAAGALMECEHRPASIGAAIAALLQDEDRHATMSRTAAAYARTEHSWPVLAERLDRIYRGQPDPETTYLKANGRYRPLREPLFPRKLAGQVATNGTFAPGVRKTKIMSEKSVPPNQQDGVPARELFDSIATKWEDKYQEDGSMNHRRERFCTVLRQYVPNKGRLLDFGCASGDLSSTFSHAGFRVSGLDQAPAMIERARSRFGTAGIEFKLLKPEEQQNIVLPFTDGEFSAIVASSVAEYLVPISTYLEEWHRVAAAGATLLMTVPNPLHPLRWLESMEIMYSRWTRTPPDRLSNRVRYLRTSVNRSGAGAWRQLLAESGWTWLGAEGWAHPLLMVIARKNEETARR